MPGGVFLPFRAAISRPEGEIALGLIVAEQTRRLVPEDLGRGRIQRAAALAEGGAYVEHAGSRGERVAHVRLPGGSHEAGLDRVRTEGRVPPCRRHGF